MSGGRWPVQRGAEAIDLDFGAGCGPAGGDGLLGIAQLYPAGADGSVQLRLSLGKLRAAGGLAVQIPTHGVVAARIVS
ncbi:hypothetical protein [Streptomyces abikoensis]|uniref:hypothetical protein n=1 Tax=Streptomyces abikoensis TaxID=97398 RepID=UPI0036CB53B1